MINVQSSFVYAFGNGKREGGIDEDPEQVSISLMGMPAENSPGAMGEWSMWTGSRGQCQIGRWDTIGNDYIKCIVVTFANRS